MLSPPGATHQNLLRDTAFLPEIDVHVYYVYMYIYVYTYIFVQTYIYTYDPK